MMTDTAIAKIVDATIAKDRERLKVDRELNLYKGQLIDLGGDPLRSKQLVPTEGGGNSWRAAGTDGNFAVVTFPGESLKGAIDPATKDGKKILKRFGHDWKKFFRRAIRFVPHEDFRARVETAYPPAVAQKLINLCEKDSEPRVSFETKDSKKK